MKFLKVLFYSVVTILIICLGFHLIVVYYTNKNSFEIATPCGDNFWITCNDLYKASLTDTRNEYTIYYLSNGKKQLVDYIYKESFDDFKYSYCDKKVHAYAVQDTLIFKSPKEKSFKTVSVLSFDLKKYDYLIPIAIYFLKEDDPGVKFVAEHLIKSGDPSVINIIEKYARGEFNEEQKQNIPKDDLEDLRRFCMKLLSKS